MEGLSYVPGLTSWQCISKEGDLYSSWSEESEKKEVEEKKEEPPTKKKRFWGFKEDPFIYCKEGDEAVSKIKASPNNLAPVKFKKYFLKRSIKQYI